MNTAHRTMLRLVLALALVIALTAIPLAGALTTAWKTTLVSTGASGIGGNGWSTSPEDNAASISADGTKVAFSSYASDLKGAATDGENWNIFVYDLTTDVTTLITKGASGTGGNGGSGAPSLSADGKFVTYESEATDLGAAGALGPNTNIFLTNVATGATVLVSRGAGGAAPNSGSVGPSISADGKFVAFDSQASNLEGAPTAGSVANIFVVSTTTGAITCVTKDSAGGEPNGDSFEASLSADGSFVAFTSYANNLAGATTSDHGNANVFLAAVNGGGISLISKGQTGSGGNGYSYSPSISGAGDLVAFMSDATDLTGTLLPSSQRNIYVAGVAGVATLVSANASGGQANEESIQPSISSDGTKVAFTTGATDISGANANGDAYNIIIVDLASGLGDIVTGGAPGDGADFYSMGPSLNADGTAVAFGSWASDLVGAPAQGGGNGEGFILNAFIAQLQNLVTVTFDPQNGTGTYPVTIVAGTTVSEPVAPPTKAGYTFVGWWTDPTGGELWDFGTPVTADITLYAHWVKNVPPMPPTGDSALIAPLVTLAILGSGLIVTGTVRTKRR